MVRRRLHLRHQRANATGVPGAAKGAKRSQTGINAKEAKPESTQSSLSPGFEPSARGPAGRERSRSAAGGAVPHNAGNDAFDPIALADEPGSRNVGRVADGIRTRDIQIHNLVP